MVATMSCPPQYRRATATRSNRRPAKATLRHRSRHSQSRPLDLDELTRRLHLVRAEQEAHAETRVRHDPNDAGSSKDKDVAPLTEIRDKPRSLPTHRHRATRDAQYGVKPHKTKSQSTASDMPTASSPREDGRGCCSNYRHIPQVAAAQFALTTTVDSPTDRQLVHQLSKKAIKFHVDGPNANRVVSLAKPDAWPFAQAQALRRVQARRQRQYERNQIQHTPTLATTAEVDEQTTRLSQRHTFEAYFRHKGTDQGGDQQESRRRSTGSILGRTDPPRVESIKMRPSFPVELEGQGSADVAGLSGHHPVDWTQSDEARTEPTAIPPHPLRKPESRWTLKGRFGNFARQGRDEKPASPPDDKKQASQEAPKSSSKGSFSAVFASRSVDSVAH